MAVERVERRESSFTKALFHGILAEDMVFPYPRAPKDTRDNVELILGEVKKFAEAEIDAKKIDEEGKIPPGVLQGLAQLGLFGMVIPEAYGGIGLSQTAYCRVMSEMAGIDSSIAVTLGAHQSIGLKGIVLFGNEAQKRKYLPPLASGEKVAAFALTEPVAGSDAAAIKTRAVLSPDGRHYILNGNKIWITNGGFASVFTVFAKTEEAQSGGKAKLTAFIVERDMGVESGPEEHKLGIKGSSTTALYFSDVKVPVENILGQVGGGFKIAMGILNNGRLGLAAGCVGAAKGLIKLSVKHALERKAFGRPISTFALIKDKIAHMSQETYALESMCYLTTGLMDRDVEDYSLESAMCKVFGSETLWRVVNEALQIAAGVGYMREYPYERMLRDARINLIFEGTNEILRAFIALGGMQSPGERLGEVSKAMRDPIKGFGILSDFVAQRIKSSIYGDRLTLCHPALKREAVYVEDYVSELSKNVEKVLRKHGKNIVEMQYTLRRVADISMDLYASIATISRTTAAIESKGEEAAAREIKLCQSFCEAASRRMNRNVRQFDKNDDERLKEVADDMYATEGYPYDVFLGT